MDAIISERGKLMNTDLYKIYHRVRPLYCPVLLIAIWGYTSIFHPDFLKITNLFIILRQSSYLGILALAMSITVIVGGIDFSIAATAALSSTICVMLMNFHVPAAAAVGLGMLAAVFCGLLNGIILSFTVLEPYYITIGTMTLFFCGASIIKSTFPSQVLSNEFSFIGKGYVGPVPAAVLLLFLIYVIMSVILNHTYYGRYLFALGSNPTGLAFIGISTRKYKTFAYVLAAFLAGIAGIILTSRNNYVNTAQDFSYIVDAIFAITLGGVRFQGNNPRISGIFLGSLLLCVISKCLNSFGISVLIQDMICCLLFLFTIAADNYCKRN